ncbi:MAG: type 2 isopentenyl-diphosphate Delta-isomerase [Promethearchaeota archaeon]
MEEKNEIIILKLGGGLLTDKNKPFSIRNEILQRSIKEIIDSNKKLILVHGGGSFGHPIAKKYGISEGIDSSIKDQLYGLTKTHEAMVKFNSIIIDVFLDNSYPAISIQPSSMFTKYMNKISIRNIDIFDTLLDLGILPVLYGDILLDKEGNFSIISGDKIIFELCKSLHKTRVTKVIFALEKDGLFVQVRSNDDVLIKFAPVINSNDLDSVILADLGDKIDVTGGIQGKFNIIKEISKLNIPIQLINGLKEKYLFKALTNQKIKCTLIKNNPKDLSKIQKRKIEHLKIPIENDVQHFQNYFDFINLIHHPLPKIELDEIDISTKFYNKNISAPICISAITGGPPISKAINRILASAAEEENIIMGVGSQRVSLENPSTIDSFRIIREVAPSIPIIGNIGIGQISSPSFQVNDFIKCIEMINADIMAIHFNALHEMVQNERNVSYKNFYQQFKKIRKEIDIPIIAKEVGSGFNQEIAFELDSMGFDGFDIGGAGGTSFAAIESFRNSYSQQELTRKLADSFRDWGIPTPISIMNTREASNKVIIATGGLRNGIDIAKSIILGADIGGFAQKFLISAWKDFNDQNILHTLKEIRTLKEELRSAMWLINLSDLRQLKGNKKKRVLLGNLYEWINQLS